VLLDVQGLPLKSDKLVGLTVKVGGGGVQFHDTVRDCGWAVPEAVKVNVPF
jgi:hypothetical protein